jgi:hypothetical protein
MNDTFMYWIRERESIRKKRNIGVPKPWTDDPILQQYRFCNVRRMDDRVSDWLLKKWYRPYRDHPNIVPAVVLARLLNRIETLEEIGFPRVWSPDRLLRKLQRRVDRGEKCFSAAYIVTGGLGGTKIEQVVHKMVHPVFLARKRLELGKTLKGSHEQMMQFKGLSSFTAGQVVMDLRWAMSGRWRDRMTWAPKGPGSTRGINRYMGRELKTKIKQEQFLEELSVVIADAKRELPMATTERLEAMDYQNCLCEFDKYERAAKGPGRMKRRYDGCA